MLKVILIDDELDARELLRGMLKNQPGCNIIGEAHSLSDACILLKNTQPDIVFLDIQLMDGTGFDVLTQYPKPSFEVVFVTAYNEFALKAFQYNAIDYILKPITSSDLARVLYKIQRHQHSQDDFHKQLQTLMISMQEFKHENLVLKTSHGMHFLPLSEIMYLKCEGNYTTVFTEKKKILWFPKT